MDNVKILAIVGMSGSGKSVIVDHLTEKGKIDHLIKTIKIDGKIISKEGL